MEIEGCPSPICISQQQACEETCGGKCDILDSDPAQVSCKNKAKGHP